MRAMGHWNPDPPWRIGDAACVRGIHRITRTGADTEAPVPYMLSEQPVKQNALSEQPVKQKVKRATCQ
jgi:hypothetical protein